MIYTTAAANLSCLGFEIKFVTQGAIPHWLFNIRFQAHVFDFFFMILLYYSIKNLQLDMAENPQLYPVDYIYWPNAFSPISAALLSAAEYAQIPQLETIHLGTEPPSPNLFPIVLCKSLKHFLTRAAKKWHIRKRPSSGGCTFRLAVQTCIWMQQSQHLFSSDKQRVRADALNLQQTNCLPHWPPSDFLPPHNSLCCIDRILILVNLSK